MSKQAICTEASETQWDLLHRLIAFVSKYNSTAQGCFMILKITLQTKGLALI